MNVMDIAAHASKDSKETIARLKWTSARTMSATTAAIASSRKIRTPSLFRTQLVDVLKHTLVLTAKNLSAMRFVTNLMPVRMVELVSSIITILRKDTFAFVRLAYRAIIVRSTRTTASSRHLMERNPAWDMASAQTE